MPPGIKWVESKKKPKAATQPPDALTILAEFCFHYPAYTLSMARRVPYIHVKRMIETARKLKAKEYWELTQIVAAPHATDGNLVEKLINKYGDRMNGRI